MKNTFRATLESSDNQYLKHPCQGRVQIVEYFLDGRVAAVFQEGVYEGANFKPKGAFVSVPNAKFSYS